MILNPIGLIQEATTLSTVPVVKDRSIKASEHSFFIETLQFLSEMNVSYYEANRNFYRTLAESTDISVVHESFGDFFSKVKEIIDKFLAFIKSLVDRFVTMLNGAIGRDKHIIKHKKEFDNFSSIHEFHTDGFHYTITEAIPIINAKAAFDNDFMFEFNGDTIRFETPSGDDTIAKRIKNHTKTLSDGMQSGEYYDAFRAEVIGHDDPISKDDFANKLFAEFRDGESIAEEITINFEEVRAALCRFETAKNDIEKVKKTKSRIDSEYTSIKRTVEKMVNTNRNGSTVVAKFDPKLNTNDYTATTKDDIIAMDNFVKAKVNQIQEMSNIHALAFAAKLDAMKDCYRQDKVVLFKALSRVQSNKKEEV